MTADLRYYLSVLLRRLHYVILIFLAVTALSAYFALRLPTVYESTARLLMESPQIPDALAAPTVDIAALEQLQVVEQRLMTRANLLEIARKFAVLPEMGSMAPDDIVAAMRANTVIVKQAGRDQATLMTITFSAGNAQTAAAVVNDYVTRILTDNTATRTSQAQDTLQFFQQEVERLGADLSSQSAKILEFQDQNADALPNTLNYRMTEQSNLQERLGTIQRDIAGLEDQKRRLVEIFRSTGQLENERVSPPTPEEAQLAALETELAQALAVLAPENPKVVLLQARVAEMRAQVEAKAAEAAASLSVDGEGATEAPMTLLEIQASEIDSQIALLTEESESITAQLAVLKDSIDRSAAVSVQLETLLRDQANIQAQYDAATERLSAASTGERIAVLSKGQRIGVLDAATVPDTPARPNRTRITLMGAAVGLMLGLGFVLLLELLNGSVRRSIDLERHLNIVPIGVIPYVATPGEVLRKRILVLFLVLVVAGGVPGLAWLVDTYYMPLDLVLDKVARKLGL